MTCKKAQGFLETNEWRVHEQTDASKQRKGRDEALALAKTVDTLVVAKGKKTTVLDMNHDTPDDDALAALLLGPTGNLKAPTMRLGNVLLVGFNEEAYRGYLKQ